MEETLLSNSLKDLSMMRTPFGQPRFFIEELDLTALLFSRRPAGAVGSLFRVNYPISRPDRVIVRPLVKTSGTGACRWARIPCDLAVVGMCSITRHGILTRNARTTVTKARDSGVAVTSRIYG
jgi:hypothetical protein